MIKSFPKEDISLFKRAISYVKPYKLLFTISFICVLSGIGFGLIQPVIWAKMLTGLFEQNYQIMFDVIMYMVIVFILTTVISFLQSYIFSLLNQKIVYDLKRDMFINILKLPIKAFDQIKTGEFMSRLNNDAAIISSLITGQLLNSIINILKVIIIGVAMFLISIELSVITLISFPCTYLIFLLFGRIMRKKQLELAKLNDNYFSTIKESIGGIREIKCLGIKVKIETIFLNLIRFIKNKSIKLGITGSFAQSATQAVKFTTEVIAILLGFYFIINNKLTVESFIVFMAYSEQFSTALMELSQLNSTLQQALVSIGRIFEVIDHFNYTNEKYGEKSISSIKGYIRFEDIHFRYEGNMNILKGINFEIRPGTKVAFVGESGVGKTTIFNLILRFYSPNKGQIKIDGTDIKDFDEKSLCKNISVVRQEPFLFNMSIKDNLMISSPEATREEIEEACKYAYIHDYITTLPLGYDSVIGENGVNFSGGQRQRIAIARAILKKSQIILFDEATSALDNESQYAIKEAIDKLAQSNTILIIAHRLFTVIDCDEIFVLQRGEIVGIGTHRTLIQSNDIYKKLYQVEVDHINEKMQPIDLII